MATYRGSHNDNSSGAQNAALQALAVSRILPGDRTVELSLSEHFVHAGEPNHDCLQRVLAEAEQFFSALKVSLADAIDQAFYGALPETLPGSCAILERLTRVSSAVCDEFFRLEVILKDVYGRSLAQDEYALFKARVQEGMARIEMGCSNIIRSLPSKMGRELVPLFHDLQRTAQEMETCCTWRFTPGPDYVPEAGDILYLGGYERVAVLGSVKSSGSLEGQPIYEADIVSCNSFHGTFTEQKQALIAPADVYEVSRGGSNRWLNPLGPKYDEPPPPGWYGCPLAAGDRVSMYDQTGSLLRGEILGRDKKGHAVAWFHDNGEIRLSTIAGIIQAARYPTDPDLPVLESRYRFDQYPDTRQILQKLASPLVNSQPTATNTIPALESYRGNELVDLCNQTLSARYPIVLQFSDDKTKQVHAPVVQELGLGPLLSSSLSRNAPILRRHFCVPVMIAAAGEKPDIIPVLEQAHREGWEIVLVEDGSKHPSLGGWQLREYIQEWRRIKLLHPEIAEHVHIVSASNLAGTVEEIGTRARDYLEQPVRRRHNPAYEPDHTLLKDFAHEVVEIMHGYLMEILPTCDCIVDKLQQEHPKQAAQEFCAAARELHLLRNTWTEFQRELNKAAIYIESGTKAAPIGTSLLERIEALRTHLERLLQQVPDANLSGKVLTAFSQAAAAAVLPDRKPSPLGNGFTRVEDEPTRAELLKISAGLAKSRLVPDDPGIFFHGITFMDLTPAELESEIATGTRLATTRDPSQNITGVVFTVDPCATDQMRPGVSSKLGAPGQFSYLKWVWVDPESGANDPFIYSRLMNAAILMQVTSGAKLLGGRIHSHNLRSVRAGIGVAGVRLSPAWVSEVDGQRFFAAVLDIDEYLSQDGFVRDFSASRRAYAQAQDLFFQQFAGLYPPGQGNAADVQVKTNRLLEYIEQRLGVLQALEHLEATIASTRRWTPLRLAARELESRLQGIKNIFLPTAFERISDLAQNILEDEKRPGALAELKAVLAEGIKESQAELLRTRRELLRRGAQCERLDDVASNVKESSTPSSLCDAHISGGEFRILTDLPLRPIPEVVERFNLLSPALQQQLEHIWNGWHGFGLYVWAVAGDDSVAYAWGRDRIAESVQLGEDPFQGHLCQAWLKDLIQPSLAASDGRFSILDLEHIHEFLQAIRFAQERAQADLFDRETARLYNQARRAYIYGRV